MLTYGLVLEIGGADLRAIQAVLRDWCAEKLQRGRGRNKNFTPTEHEFESDAGHLWTFQLRETGDAGGAWFTEVHTLVSADQGSPLPFAVTMHAEPEEGRVLPFRPYVETPRFVRTLGERFQVSLAGTPLHARHREVSHPEFVDVLLGELVDPARAVPVVAIAEPAHGTSPIPDLPPRLAKFLFGLANVVWLPKDAAHALVERVGRDLACFNGGVRIYWPGFRADDPPRRHPLFIGRRIESSAEIDPAQPDKVLRTSLMSAIASAAASRFRTPRAIEEAIRAAERASIEQQIGTLGAAELKVRLHKLEEALAYERAIAEQALRENTQSIKDLRDAMSELEAARREIDRLRGQITNPGIDAADKDPWATIPDLHGAVERARTDFGTTLVLPSGVVQDTNLPGGLWYHALEAIHQLCTEERAGRATNKRELIRTLMADRVGINNPDYKAAPTSVFAVDPATGNRIELRERVHLKSGAPSETESIYWATIGDDRSRYCYLVGRLGRHA